MTYKEIIKTAWQITNEEKKTLFPFGFVPSFFGMIIGIIIISYQINAFAHSPFFGSNKDGYLIDLVGPIWVFLKHHPSLAVMIVLMAFFILMMYIFTPIICGGALVDLITKKHYDKPLKGGFARGLSAFFPLFEFSTIMSVFGIQSYLTETSMILRNFGSGTWVFIIPVLTTILIIGTFLSLLFIFAEQLIVLEDDNVIQAMKKSTLLVLGNVKDTLFLGITIALIATRVFINIFIILLIPLFFMAIVALMASFALKWLGVSLGILIGITILISGAYLMATFHIFTYAIWTISFIEFRKEEDANKIIIN